MSPRLSAGKSPAGHRVPQSSLRSAKRHVSGYEPFGTAHPPARRPAPAGTGGTAWDHSAGRPLSDGHGPGNAAVEPARVAQVAVEHEDPPARSVRAATRSPTSLAAACAWGTSWHALKQGHVGNWCVREPVATQVHDAGCSGRGGRDWRLCLVMPGVLRIWHKASGVTSWRGRGRPDGRGLYP